MIRFSLRMALFCLTLLSPSIWAGDFISAGEAIRIAQSRAEGKVLSAELVRPSNGSPYYRVKMLSNGKIRTVQVNATSGK